MQAVPNCFARAKSGRLNLIRPRLDHHLAHIYNLPVHLGTNKKELQASEQKNPAEWEAWARQLKRWGLSTFAASLIESGGAFTTLAAQGLYIGQPLADPWSSAKNLQRLAHLLEDSEQSIRFAHFLRDQTE